MGGSGGKKERRKSKISGTCSSMTPASCNFFFPKPENCTWQWNCGYLLIFFLPFLFWPLQEAIRVILGNLDDLHPFSTDHFTIFLRTLSFLLVKEKVQWLVSVGHCLIRHSCLVVRRSLAGVRLLWALQFYTSWRSSSVVAFTRELMYVKRMFCSVFRWTPLRSKSHLARENERVYIKSQEAHVMQLQGKLVRFFKRLIKRKALLTGAAALAH